MMAGINLHALVRRAIATIHPDEVVTLYSSLGDVNVKGVLTPTFAEPVEITVQIQSMSSDALVHAERAGQNAHVRKLWTNDPAITLQSVDRETNRGGDMIKRADASWWLVDAVEEDFSRSGWKSARIVLQTRAPAL